MAFVLMKRTGRYLENFMEFTCDTAADIENLPTTLTNPAAPFGSWAYVIADSSVYRLNSTGSWIKQNNGGGGEVSEPISISQVETDEYLVSYEIYQGETLVGTINVPKQTIEDGSIGKDQLSNDVQTVLNATINSKDGANGMRYYEDSLEVKTGKTWNQVDLDGFKL